MTISCSTCKFWYTKNEDGDHIGDWSAERLGLGMCNQATMLCNATEYKKEANIKEPERKLPPKEGEPDDEDGVILVELDGSREMYVNDGSSYFAVLYTKPDFFCSQHKALEKIKDEAK